MKTVRSYPDHAQADKEECAELAREVVDALLRHARGIDDIQEHIVHGLTLVYQRSRLAYEEALAFVGAEVGE